MTGSLDALFRPRGIAVVGASADELKPGGRTLHILRSFGYAGAIYPVTPSHNEIDGLPCFASIADVPGPVDVAVMCISASRMSQAVRDAAAAGVKVAVVYASEFNGDAEAIARRDELSQVQQETGIRILGPNTIGSRGIVQDGVFATFSHEIESGITPGGVAIVAQSGGLGVYFGSAFLRTRGPGTRYLVDTGNELDITAAEVIENFSADPEVSCIGAILEGSHDGRRLLAAISAAAAAGKPVVLLKTGRTDAAAASLASHTGSIAGTLGLFEVAARDAGAIVADDETAFVDIIALLEAGIRPKGRRLGIVTPSGGFAIMALDAADRYGLQVPPPTDPPTPAEAVVLASGDLANPFDYTSRGAVTNETLKLSLQWMVRQNVDAVLFWQAGSLFLDWRQRLLHEALDVVLPLSPVPIIGCGLAPDMFVQELKDRGVMWFEEPTRAVRAIALDAPPAVGVDAPAPSEHADAETPYVVVGTAARNLLDFIPHVRTTIVESAADAERASADGPVVLKVESSAHPHKSEFGLVSNLVAGVDAARGFEQIDAARALLGIQEPIVVQPVERGVELVMGGFTDAVFGPCVMVGLGGIHVEIFADVQLAVAPIDHAKAYSMLTSLKSWPLLNGARGAAPSDVTAVADALVGLSQFMSEHAEQWQAVDLNPVIVRAQGEGLVAVDALLVPQSEVMTHA